MMKTLEQQMADARAAERVLTDECFVAVCTDIEREAFAIWRKSAATDLETREAQYQLVKALDKVIEKLGIVKDRRSVIEKQMRDRAIREAREAVTQ